MSCSPFSPGSLTPPLSFCHILGKENGKWHLKLPTTNRHQPPLLFFPDEALKLRQQPPPPRSRCRACTSMPIGSLSQRWHRLLRDTRQRAIFLLVTSTYSPCHETKPHLIRRRAALLLSTFILKFLNNELCKKSLQANKGTFYLIFSVLSVK